VDGRAGDYFVRSRQLLAVIRAADGSLVDLAPGPDFIDRLGWGKIALCDSLGRHAIHLTAIDIVTGRRPAIVVRGRAWWQRDWLEVQTELHIPARRRHLVITTTVANPHPRRVWRNLGVCDHLGTGNTRLFVPGVGHVLKPGLLEARFCGREERGVSTVLMVPPRAPPMLLDLRLSPPVPAFDPSIDASYGRTSLEPGRRLVVRRVLALGRKGLHQALAEALLGTGQPTRQVQVKQPSAEAGRLMLRQGGTPFVFTSVLEQTERLTLPRGRYAVSLFRPGIGEGPASQLDDKTDKLDIAAPASVELGLRVEVDGSPSLPVKLVIRGVGGTPDPDFGNDGGLQADNALYVESGDGSVRLAPGRYRITATRGFDYTIASTELLLRPGRRATRRLSLRRIGPAEGWAAVDPHLHSSSSFDCPIAPPDRLISAGALGLDLMVFTDHNAVTRYQPKEPGLLPLVVTGQEVTTTGNLFGHFNVFPLGHALGAHDTSPSVLFRQARARKALIQVNHPRMGSIGYFDQMGLDTRTCRARSRDFDGGFELLEVFNGDHIDQPAQVEQVLADWFALLNAGRRHVATGGSDAHRLPYQDPGYPRTYVLWDDSAGRFAKSARRGASPGVRADRVKQTSSAKRLEAAAVLQALRQGRAVVSTGPRVELTVDGKHVGSEVKLGPKGSSLRVRVQAAPWIDVRQVELWRNGERVQTTRLPPRRAILRMDRTLTIRPATDSWYVVIVRGERPDPTQHRRVIPFAVTNPVWVDADRDGKVAIGADAPASAPAKSGR